MSCVGSRMGAENPEALAVGSRAVVLPCSGCRANGFTSNVSLKGGYTGESIWVGVTSVLP